MSVTVTLCHGARAALRAEIPTLLCQARSGTDFFHLGQCGTQRWGFSTVLGAGTRGGQRGLQPVSCCSSPGI